MSTDYESAGLAMNELWKQGDGYLREAVDNGLADVDAVTDFGRLRVVYTDDDSLRILRSNDELEVDGTLLETKNGGLVEVTYRVEWGWDMRLLPKVYRDELKGNTFRNVGTVPRREFTRVAQSIGQLISSAASPVLQPS